MSMADRDGVIWYDGELVPWRDATTHVLTHTLHYGMGVFEGVRAYNTPDGTAIFRLQAHTDRLFDSAHIFNMQIPFTKEEINEAQRAAVRENGLESAYLRPMVFFGSEGMGLRASGLKVHVIVAAWHWGAYMGEAALEAGIKVRTSSYTRHHVNIAMTRAKANGNYINSMLALQEAISGGADEAMLLDPEGYVAEGSGENIFLGQGWRGVHPGSDLLPQRHYPQHRPDPGRRAGHQGGREAHHPRRGVHRRRGLLHRYRRRSDPDP